MSDAHPSAAVPPPPAWHPDPANSGLERWWDGAQWTEHLRTPAAQTYSPTPSYSPSVASEVTYVEPNSYIPMGSYATASSETATHLSRRRGSPNTFPIWVIALYPLLGVATRPVTVLAIMTLPGWMAPYVPLGLSLFVLLVMVIWDSSILRRRGLPGPSFLWFFATFFVYALVRWINLRRVGVHNSAPGVVLIVWLVAIITAILVIFRSGTPNF